MKLLKDKWKGSNSNCEYKSREPMQCDKGSPMYSQMCFFLSVSLNFSPRPTTPVSQAVLVSNLLRYCQSFCTAGAPNFPCSTRMKTILPEMESFSNTLGRYSNKKAFP